MQKPVRSHATLSSESTRSPRPVPASTKSDSIVTRFFAWMFVLVVAFFFAAGWWQSYDSIFIPREGTGYLLGIIGGSMMLAILLYPARKHVRIFSSWGKPKYWLRLHMLLGICGPLLIAYHANFRFGTNTTSNIALISLILVVSSGIIGRFFYRQVYNVMYDHHYTIDQIMDELKQQRSALSHSIELSARSLSLLSQFETLAKKKRGFLGHLFSLPYIRYSSRKYSKHLISLVRHEFSNSEKYRSLSRKARYSLFVNFQTLIHRYFLTLRKTANLALYERLFSFWHLLHFPMYIVLIFTGILHVISVHKY